MFIFYFLYFLLLFRLFRIIFWESIGVCGKEDTSLLFLFKNLVQSLNFTFVRHMTRSGMQHFKLHLEPLTLLKEPPVQNIMELVARIQTCRSPIMLYLFGMIGFTPVTDEEKTRRNQDVALTRNAGNTIDRAWDKSGSFKKTKNYKKEIITITNNQNSGSC